MIKKICLPVLVCVIMLLAACGQNPASPDPTPDEPADIHEDIGGDFHADPIYGVFRDAETGEIDKQIIGQINYYGSANMEEYVDNLSFFTGLNFAVSITEDEIGTVVEWLPQATIFDREAVAGTMFNENSDQVAYHFADNNALRLFMLDSLFETLYMAYDLRYTMDGGQDLVLEGLTPVDTFPADSVYEIRP